MAIQIKLRNCDKIKTYTVEGLCLSNKSAFVDTHGNLYIIGSTGIYSVNSKVFINSPSGKFVIAYFCDISITLDMAE